MGPPQAGPMWAGPAWGWAPGMAMGPAYGAGYGAGPGWGYGPSYAPAYYGGLPTDSEIEEMIYDAIDADPLIPFDANVDVSVEAGTVYLRGEVPSKRMKHAAGDDAWWIAGVVDVHNEIKVTARKRVTQEGAAA
ncbi:MAG TPA: BON domain-containing protein [Armatimonadota bacterium]|nr:BON domain-containing protein [Armatimonadota bacterium]